MDLVSRFTFSPQQNSSLVTACVYMIPIYVPSLALHRLAFCITSPFNYFDPFTHPCFLNPYLFLWYCRTSTGHDLLLKWCLYFSRLLSISLRVGWISQQTSVISFLVMTCLILQPEIKHTGALTSKQSTHFSAASKQSWIILRDGGLKVPHVCLGLIAEICCCWVSASLSGSNGHTFSEQTWILVFTKVNLFW